MQWAMAPIVWDGQGRASQKLFMFRPMVGSGFALADPASLMAARDGVQQSAQQPQQAVTPGQPAQQSTQPVAQPGQPPVRFTPQGLPPELAPKAGGSSRYAPPKATRPSPHIRTGQ